MERRMWLLLTVLAVSTAAPVSADDGFVDLELTVPLALADRASTGTDDGLRGYGYDGQAGLLTGAEMRLYADSFGRYLRVGLVAGAAHHAGPVLGLHRGHAFRTTLVDAGVAVRTIFPCMSDETIRWHLAGLLGVTGAYADAGEGVDGAPNGDLYDQRRVASTELDHAGLGWRFAVDLSVHIENFIVGVALGVRQYFGIDTPVSRGWITDIGLRLGGRIDLGDHPRG